MSGHLTGYFVIPPASLFICPSTIFPEKMSQMEPWTRNISGFSSQPLLLQIGMGQHYVAQWCPITCWCHWSYSSRINWDKIRRRRDLSTASLKNFIKMTLSLTSLCKGWCFQVAVAPPWTLSGVGCQFFNCSCSRCLWSSERTLRLCSRLLRCRPPSQRTWTSSPISQCLAEMGNWMKTNWLIFRLNTDGSDAGWQRNYVKELAKPVTFCSFVEIKRIGCTLRRLATASSSHQN